MERRGGHRERGRRKEGENVTGLVIRYQRGAGRIRTGDDGFAIRCLSHLATAPHMSAKVCQLREPVKATKPFG